MTPEERREEYRALKPEIEHLHKDMGRLERTIDRLVESVGSLERILLLMGPRIEALEKRERPCDWFERHIAEHGQRAERWWTVWVRVGAGIITWIIAAALGATFAVWGTK